MFHVLYLVVDRVGFIDFKLKMSCAAEKVDIINSSWSGALGSNFDIRDLQRVIVPLFQIDDFVASLLIAYKFSR